MMQDFEDKQTPKMTRMERVLCAVIVLWLCAVAWLGVLAAVRVIWRAID